MLKMQKNFLGVKKLLPEFFIIQREVTTTKTPIHILRHCNSCPNVIKLAINNQFDTQRVAESF